VTNQTIFLFTAFPFPQKLIFRAEIGSARLFQLSSRRLSIKGCCYERDNGYKTHRAKRSCLFQAHYKNDDNLEGIRKRKQEAIWQSTFSFPLPLTQQPWTYPVFLAWIKPNYGLKVRMSPLPPDSVFALLIARPAVSYKRRRQTPIPPQRICHKKKSLKNIFLEVTKGRRFLPQGSSKFDSLHGGTS
jgi:hypothetical protein